MKNSLSVRRLHPDAKLPARAHPDDAGLDLFSIQESALVPHEPVLVPTGIAIALPEAHVGLICDRSSLGARGIRVLGGVVDAGYRGEVQVVLINLRNDPIHLGKGDKIAQLLVLPVSLCAVEERGELPASIRGSAGFGSSGS